MFRKFVRLTTILFFTTPFLMAQILPPDRRIDWDPGIPGGIPEITGPVKNIIDFGADPKGINDSRAAIVSAMNALPSSGGVVFIPAGTFIIKSKITVGKSNIVFRGEGRNSILLMDFADDCFDIITYQRGDWQNLTTDIPKGTLTLTVPDGSKFKVNKYAEIEEDNDPDIMYTDPEWNQSWAEYAVGQLFRIKKIEGNELTFEAPVNFDFSSELNVSIRPQGFVEYVGFENFYIEKLKAGGNTFMFKNAALCWMRNVESYHTRNSHVTMTACYALEIRDNYFHRSFSYGGGGSGYGVSCDLHVTNSLIENNVFDSLRHAMMVHIGANGNVFGYNYSVHPVQGDGETNLNQGWTPPDISIHGHYPFMNLFEGNDVMEIGIGDYWGPAGPGNTFFRNKVRGDGIIFYDHSDYQNVIGNVTRILRDNDNNSDFELEHGNVVNGKVIWDPNIEDHTLPASYYLDSIPDFFNGSDWPVFGPDTQNSNKLPAQLRLENLLSENSNKSIKKNEYNIYPNPCNSVLYISNITKVKSIELFDISGKKLTHQSPETESITLLDFSDYRDGLYLLRLIDKNDFEKSVLIMHKN